MKILVDENISKMTVHSLQSDGFDVTDVRGTEKQGKSDEILWELAKKEGRLFITTDRGFVSHRNENHFGFLVICLGHPNRKRIHDRIIWAISHIPSKKWSGLTMVVKEKVYSTWRVRRQGEIL